MAQFDPGDMESPLSGEEFVNSRIEPMRDAIYSTHSGPSRPSYARDGLIWLDTSSNPWVLKMCLATGDVDMIIGRFDTSTGTFVPAGAAVAASATDTTPGTLTQKITAGAGIQITTANPGGNEQRVIAMAAKTSLAMAGYRGSGTFDEIFLGNGLIRDDQSLAVNYASQAEAEAGAINHKVMTPLRTAQAMDFRRFVSSPQTITSGGLLTIAHGLGSTPFLITARLECVNNNNGWVAGDVAFVAFQNNSDATNNKQHAVYADATNVYWRFSNQGAAFSMSNKGTGATFGITNSDWNLIIGASL